MKRKEYAHKTKSIIAMQVAYITHTHTYTHTHTHTHRSHMTENVLEYCRTYLLRDDVKSQQ
jgi:hypothetical protein